MGAIGVGAAAEQIERLARAIHRAGEHLASDEPAISHYAASLAAGVGAFADRVRAARVDEAIDATRHLARRNPALFLLGSLAVGFVLSRLIKGSVRRDRPRTEYDYLDGELDTATDHYLPHDSSHHTTRRTL
jgi:hypothetical protein